MSSILRFPRLNNVILSGRLTRDVEVRYSNQSMMIAKLSLAFDRVTKDEYGNFQNQANFIDAVAFGKTAETCNDQLHKGSPVIIEGSLSIKSFTDQNGQNRKFTEIMINKIYPLEKDDNQAEYGHAKENNSTFDNVPVEHPFSEEPVNNKVHTEEDVPF